MSDTVTKFLLAVGLGFSVASCTQPAAKTEDRLVAGDELPSRHVLSREKIEINRGFGGEGFGEHFLSFELASNDMLSVTYTNRAKDTVIGSEAFTLDSDVAMQARQQLWRVRPEQLKGIETDVRPLGCVKRWDHDSPEIAVGFAASDRDFGVFDLPRASSCNNPAAKAARQMLEDVLKSFPRSKVLESFLKAQAANE